MAPSDPEDALELATEIGNRFFFPDVHDMFAYTGPKGERAPEIDSEQEEEARPVPKTPKAKRTRTKKTGLPTPAASPLASKSTSKPAPRPSSQSRSPSSSPSLSLTASRKFPDLLRAIYEDSDSDEGFEKPKASHTPLKRAFDSQSSSFEFPDESEEEGMLGVRRRIKRPRQQEVHRIVEEQDSDTEDLVAVDDSEGEELVVEAGEQAEDSEEGSDEENDEEAMHSAEEAIVEFEKEEVQEPRKWFFGLF